MKAWMSICAMGLAAVLLVACESTESGGDVVTVTPATVELAGKGKTASFVASFSTTNDTLVLPLTWSLSNGGLGRIVSAAGSTAVYESNGKEGANTIKVRDQIGREGLASITQVKPVSSNTTASASSAETPGIIEP